MPAPDRPTAAACALGVTGKRLRRALPLPHPSPAVRAALWQAITEVTGHSSQVTGVQKDAERDHL